MIACASMSKSHIITYHSIALHSIVDHSTAQHSTTYHDGDRWPHLCTQCVIPLSWSLDPGPVLFCSLFLEHPAGGWIPKHVLWRLPGGLSLSVAPFWKGESFAKTGFGHMRPQHDAQHTHYIHQLIIVWPMCRPSPIFVSKNCVPRLQWQALAQRSGRTMSIIEAIFRIPTGGQHGYVRCVVRYCRSFVCHSKA